MGAFRSVAAVFVEYLRTYHMMMSVDGKKTLFTCKPTPLDPEPLKAETVRTNNFTVALVLAQLANAYSERTITFKSAISNGHLS